jgi:hypothetical protein
VLGCTVEELFRLPEHAPCVEAELFGELPASETSPTRLQVARVGERLLAHPLTGTMAAFTAADGLLVAAAAESRLTAPQVQVELLVEAQVPEHTVVVLG